jgi:protein SCO1/2
VFIKVIIVLLLLIVAASLLVQRTGNQGKRAKANLRPLMMRMAFVLLAIAAGAALVHFLSGCAKPGESFHAQDVTGADFGRLDKLDGFIDHRGSRLASADFLGKVVVVFFGYTHCPDICPTTLTTMKEVVRMLGPASDRVQVLFVTVDPERDTQEVLAAYVPWFDARFLGAYGDAQTTVAAAREFRVYFSKVKGNSALDYSIDHTAASFAYDTQGRLRLLINHGATAQQISEDLSKLLAGK